MAMAGKEDSPEVQVSLLTGLQSARAPGARRNSPAAKQTVKTLSFLIAFLI
jgi:hypothetical protein